MVEFDGKLTLGKVKVICGGVGVGVGAGVVEISPLEQL
jgi:hypothetical protein